MQVVGAVKGKLDAGDGISLSDVFSRLWARRGGVSLVPVLFATVAALVVIVSSLEKLDMTGSVITALSRINAMHNGLSMVMNNNRLSVLRTNEDCSPVDPLIKLENFQLIWFNPITAFDTALAGLSDY